MFVPGTIPSPLERFYAHFPLLVVPSPHATTAPPERPTVWAYGPPPKGHAESLDPLCRAAQAFARFSLAAPADVRWLDWDGKAGAPGGALPALHTPEGDLLVGEEVSGWIAAQVAPKGRKDGAFSFRGTGSVRVGALTTTRVSRAGQVPPVDPAQQAYLSLVATTLLPAVLAALYLSPPSLVPPVVPRQSRPVLSEVAHTYLSWNDRAARIDEVKRFRGGKTGRDAVLDLDEVEREAEDAIKALEVKLAGTKEGWFGGASTPSRIDALAYALLSIISILPPTCDKVLRPALERCPGLLAWIRAHDP
ncbi:hypothetical protein JCM3770_007185 [Rhodotorula araucariae]